jgi:3-hydroxyacyl-CoA dehydrogenase
MNNWQAINDILQSSERVVSGGIAIAHTFTTPEFIELRRLISDAQYESEAAERTIQLATRQLAAQRAIVAADDEWFRLRFHPNSTVSEIHSAARVMATARAEAKRIDKEATNEHTDPTK